MSTYRKPKDKQQLMSPNKINCASASLSALQIKCLSKLSRPQKVLNYCHHIFSTFFGKRKETFEGLSETLVKSLILSVLG